MYCHIWRTIVGGQFFGHTGRQTTHTQTKTTMGRIQRRSYSTRKVNSGLRSYGVWVGRKGLGVNQSLSSGSHLGWWVVGLTDTTRHIHLERIHFCMKISCLYGFTSGIVQPTWSHITLLISFLTPFRSFMLTLSAIPKTPFTPQPE